jgi:hypothetical protein
VLPLLAVDLIGALAFATLYAAAASLFLARESFMLGLLALFLLVSLLWVRVERWQNGSLELVRRVGRAAFGLVAAVAVSVVVVLLPLFWLEGKLPPEAGMARLSALAMASLLFAFVHLALVHVAGSLIIAAGAMVARLYRR